MSSLAKRHWFMLAMLAVVIIAFRFPGIGAQDGILRREITINLAIILIFFMQGWMLPTEVLARSALRWKAHLFVQTFIFLFFPLLVLFGDLFWSGYLSGHLRIGFYLLGVLPTTISSAVVFTSQSGGSTGISLVNTTVSNVIGVFITPLWMSLLVTAGSVEIGDLSAVLLKLSKLILVPIIVGQVAHLLSRSIITKIKRPAGLINQFAILYIVFAVFAQSVDSGVWDEQGLQIVIATVVISLVIYGVVNALCLWLIQAFKFTREDRSAVFFCCTQKTMGAGVPLAVSLFGSDPAALGVILLPMMVFHPVHLILGTLWFPYFRKQKSPA